MPLPHETGLDSPPVNGADASTEWMSRYARLTEAIYTVKRLCPRLAALGTSTLNPRHPLPPDQLRLMDRLAQAEDAASSGRRALPSWPALVARWMWCVGYALRETLRLAAVRWQCRGALRRLRRARAEVVMKTWGFGAEFFDGSRDFYYGTLPAQLQARGIRSLLLVGDTREKMDRPFVDEILRCAQGPAMPEEALIPLWAPLAVACRQLAAALSLFRLAAHTSVREVALVSLVTCHTVVQPITLRNTLHFYAARNAVRRWGARAYLTLYEGQPWEQPSWQGAKAARSDCVIVGYQHTIVMRHSLSVLQPNHQSWECSAPEVVLCVGQVTRRLMAPGHAPRGTRLVTFGTFRRSAGDRLHDVPHPDRRTVLVLPEGNLPESEALFEFAIQAAERLSDHRFIFRCHPMLPFEQVRPHLRAVPERYPNIAFSGERSIAEEFQRSSILLYRGSSAVLYALLHGVKPIYVEAEGSPDIDPLFELTDWRERVASIDAFADSLQRYAASSRDEAIAQWRGASVYAQAYVKPVDDEAIDELLEAVGLTRPTVETQ